MAFQYNPVDGFKNTVSFPNPNTEVAARTQVQSLLDQVGGALSDLQTLLASTTPGASGAEHTGSPTIAGLAGNTVYTQIANMLAIAQAAQAGTIIPGSVLDSMLSNTAGQIKDRVNDLAYQLAGGTATALTLTTSTLINGYYKTFIASANNGGAATTVNTIPLYKPNTTTAPTLIAGKAYTIWYNLAGNCFFIKASAEGTATVANVLAGATFSNENDTGLIGTATIESLGGRKVASGTVTNTSATLIFKDQNNTNTTALGYLAVSGLDFTPNTVEIISTVNGTITTCSEDIIIGSARINKGTSNFTLDGTSAYLVPGGFRMPTGWTSTTFKWRAFE